MGRRKILYICLYRNIKHTWIFLVWGREWKVPHEVVNSLVNILLASLLRWLCWCQIEPTIHFAIWVHTSCPAHEGCLDISSNHTLVSQIPPFFFPFFFLPSLFFIIYFKFWTQVWVGSRLLSCLQCYYALPAPRRTLRVVSHWSSQNLAGQAWHCATTWKTGLFQFFIFSWQKKGQLNRIRAKRSYTNFCGKKNCGRCTIKIVPTHRVRRGAGRV